MIMFDDRISRHLIYSRITLKSIQCDWNEFFVASVITASKEDLYQSYIAITYRFYFELTIKGSYTEFGKGSYLSLVCMRSTLLLLSQLAI